MLNAIFINVLTFFFLGQLVFPLMGLATSLLAGMLIRYSVLLLVQKLAIAENITFYLAFAGSFRFLYSFWKTKRLQGCFPFQWKSVIKKMAPILFAFYFTTLIGLQILEKPSADFDPAGIWFMHAKMIFHSGTLGIESGWNHPSLQSFSHVDYPKFFSALTAIFMHSFPLWDGVMPKASLLFFLFPALLLLFSFIELRFSFLFLFLACIPNLRTMLWNGFMDGYLALYTSLSLLLFARYFKKKLQQDATAALLCLGVIASLKNEGLLFVFSLIISLGFTFFLNKPAHFRSQIKLLILEQKPSFFLASFPLILWSVDKKNWGLKNDLNLGTGHSFQNLIARIGDGSSLALILDAMLLKNHPLRDALSLSLAFMLIYALRRKLKINFDFPLEIKLILSCIGLYFMGLFLIYLMTPYSLDWHLSTSVDRTVLVPTLGALLIPYFFLRELESNS